VDLISYYFAGIFTTPHSCLDIPLFDGCFPSSALVSLADGTQKRMDELVIDDLVQTADATTGALSFEPVRSFIDVNRRDNVTSFFALKHDAGDQIVATANHLIFASVDVQTPPIDIRVDQVQVGMYLWLVVDGKVLKPVRVIDVALHSETGYFAPMTGSGTIIVNGVLCSNYIGHRSDHHLKHATYAPLRLLHRALPLNRPGELPADHLTPMAFYWSVPIIEARKAVMASVKWLIP